MMVYGRLYIGQGRKMNNQEQEPKAWWMKSNDPDNVQDYLTFDKPTREQKISHRAIPLYTKENDEIR